MPTAAKLFAALFTALTAAAVVWLIRADEPGMRDTIIAFAVTVPVAAFMGWRECGARAGRGYGSTMVAGIRGVIYMVIGALVVLAVMQMFKLAWSRHYDAPTEAVVDIVALALNFGKPLLQTPVVATLVGGGLLTGIMAEWAGAALALMADFFFYGTLCHPALLQAVLGRRVEVVRAHLPGHRVVTALGPEGGRPFPLLVEGGAGAEGVLVRGLSEADAARLDYYEAGFAFAIREVLVTAEGGQHPARVYFAQPGRWQHGAPWVLADWAAAWGEIVAEAAIDFMAGIGRVTPEAALARYPSVLARAASRIRARRGEGAALRRRQAVAGDVEIEQQHLAHAGFFSLEEYRLRHRRFDGTMSAPIDRTAFVSTDVVVLLPYDPVRDRVLLVEQFRIAPFARGDANPWLLEPIAGRVDAGETPEAAARREAGEEAGLRVGDLIAGPRFYPSPGAKTEHVYSFLALADLPDGAAGFGGLHDEGEDIRAHVLSFTEAEALMDSGEIATGPLWVLLLWLAPRRAAYRAAAAARLGG